MFDLACFSNQYRQTNFTTLVNWRLQSAVNSRQTGGLTFACWPSLCFCSATSFTELRSTRFSDSRPLLTRLFGLLRSAFGSDRSPLAWSVRIISFERFDARRWFDDFVRSMAVLTHNNLLCGAIKYSSFDCWLRGMEWDFVEIVLFFCKGECNNRP